MNTLMRLGHLSAVAICATTIGISQQTMSISPAGNSDDHEKPRGPTITWTPRTLDQTAYVGITTITQISFFASETLSDILVQVDPELKAFVTVSPASFDSVPGGRTMNLSISISGSGQNRAKMVDGTIKIRKNVAQRKDGGVFARPLPVRIIFKQVGLVDQSSTSGGNAGASINECCRFIAQTYTAGRTGGLTGVNVDVLSSSSYPLNVAIRKAPGGIPGSIILGETTLGTGGAPFSLFIPFTQSIPQVAGTQYAIVLSYPAAPPP
ncbi:MAG TPA: hypothetical protein VK569_01645, partial [Bacteroidota bacterium]|nr:hypothetical protein [Bacteroidota bacterium]